MGAGAQLSVTDLRRATRHPVNHRVIGEHRQLGDVHLEVINLSAHGFMATEAPGLTRGERIMVGRIEAHLIWTTEGKAGFQFERIIRLDDFMKIIEELQENPRLRRSR
jgi:hypothetical protein